MTYGLMTEHDYRTMDKALQAVHEIFPQGVINSFEIGVHKGNTSRGIHGFFTERNRINFHTGIDNQSDLAIHPPFQGCHLVLGNSFEVYNELENASQHFGLVDGNHSYPITVVDVWCYAPKIKVNGLFAMHDTGEQVKDFTDYQKIGSREDKHMYISCRKVASDMGLLNPRCIINNCTFEKVIDEYDPNFHTGGLLVLKRIM